MFGVKAIGLALDIVCESKVFDHLLIGTIQGSQLQAVLAYPHPVLEAVQSIPMQCVMAFEKVEQVLGDERAEVHEFILSGKRITDSRMFKVDSPKLTGGEVKAEGEG